MAARSISFLVPTVSKATSMRASFPMTRTDSTIPCPKASCLTLSPGASCIRLPVGATFRPDAVWSGFPAGSAAARDVVTGGVRWLWPLP